MRSTWHHRGDGCGHRARLCGLRRIDSLQGREKHSFQAGDIRADCWGCHAQTNRRPHGVAKKEPPESLALSALSWGTLSNVCQLPTSFGQFAEGIAANRRHRAPHMSSSQQALASWELPRSTYQLTTFIGWGHKPNQIHQQDDGVKTQLESMSANTPPRRPRLACKQARERR